MRAPRVIVVFALFLICLVGIFFLGPRLTQYSRFQHKGDEYYTELANACNAIIAAHPVGTNQFVELSVIDVSLPEIIRDLQPQKIIVQPQRAWILHGGSIQFGITWEQDESRTNTWTLSTACESHVKVLYVASR